MRKRVFDESFKKMAIELSYARSSVKEVAEELGIRIADREFVGHKWLK